MSTNKEMDSFWATIEKERNAAEKEAYTLGRALIFKLAFRGVNEVEVTFYGSGDSGSIEEVAVDGKKCPDDLRDEIEGFAYKLLDGTGVDWYNNDGGHGTITIDVDKLTYKFEVNQYEQISHLAAEGRVTVKPDEAKA